MSFPTPTEIAVEATKTLIRTLQNPIPSTPFAHQPYDRNTAIRTITDIFQPCTTPGLTPNIIKADPMEPTTPPRAADNEPTATPPRVATTIPRHKSPRVPSTPIEQHCYPRRHIIPMDHSANMITTMIHNNNDINVDLAFQPRITTNTDHWACSIIDPDTGATMEYRHLIKSPKHQDALAQ
jgi:hypothetical protein